MKKIKIKINGRPGWHIECSVMSQKLLNTDTLDIHAGGRDLIFPHHENEIAQAEALTKKPFAKYWLHHGLLTINSQKMAKSLGNFITIKDFVKQNTTFVLKLFFLSAHYRSPLDYNSDAIHNAQANQKTLGHFFKRVHNKVKENRRECSEVKEFKDRFINAMDDDFNTPVALSVLLDMASSGNKYMDMDSYGEALSISDSLYELLMIFGLHGIKDIYTSFVTSEEVVNNLLRLQSEYEDRFKSYGISTVSLSNRRDDVSNTNLLLERFIELRNRAREKKDFRLADTIREVLSDFVVLEDTKTSTIWRRKI